MGTIHRILQHDWSSLLARVLASCSVLQVMCGATVLLPFAYDSDRLARTSPPDFVFVGLSLLLAGTAALLAQGRTRDRRTIYLAMGFLVAASSFATRSLLVLSEVWGGGAGLFASTLASIHPDAFLPYYTWEFARRFPRAIRFGRLARVQGLATRAAGWLGVLLLAVNAAVPGLRALGLTRAADALDPLLSNGNESVYWPLLLIFLLGASLFALWKVKAASPDERRRVVWLTLGILIGVAPVLIETALVFIVPAFRDYIATPEGFRVLALVAYPPMAIGPLVCAYAVLAHRALDVRVVIRRALQYAFARYSIIAVAALPFIAVLWVFYINRYETLATILSGGRVLALLALCAVGAVAVLGSRRLFVKVDRLFFREAYDSHAVLTQLVPKSQGVQSESELGDIIRGEIERALHPKRVDLLLRAPGESLLTSLTGATRSLSVTSRIAEWVSDGSAPKYLDWESPDTLPDFPVDDVHWLTDADFSLLVPLHTSDGGLIGALGLGEKRSELPYEAEDCALLAGIAGSVGLALENRRLVRDSDWARRAREADMDPANQCAGECTGCGHLTSETSGDCDRCGEAIVEAKVPLVLSGKFHFAERIGQGGMGVVYRAVDSTLGRDIAVKTLPSVSPGLSQRLRREARAMAQVDHTNLALLYSLETWRGTPLLMVEYLAGGTLFDRLRDGPLGEAAALRLGVVLAEAADCIHSVGILHRDIKPSNIGYTLKGTPKVLDFGLARLVTTPVDRAIEPFRAVVGDWAERSSETLGPGGTKTGDLVGTVPYMSPEALAGEAPDPHFDLWSICVVVHEAMTGRNPFRDKSQYLSMLRISEGTPEFEESLMGSATLEFFRDSLSAQRRRRPATAVSLRQQFESLLAS